MCHNGKDRTYIAPFTKKITKMGRPKNSRNARLLFVIETAAIHIKLRQRFLLTSGSIKVPVSLKLTESTVLRILMINLMITDVEYNHIKKTVAVDIWNTDCTDHISGL